MQYFSDEPFAGVVHLILQLSKEVFAYFNADVPKYYLNLVLP